MTRVGVGSIKDNGRYLRLAISKEVPTLWRMSHTRGRPFGSKICSKKRYLIRIKSKISCLHRKRLDCTPLGGIIYILISFDLKDVGLILILILLLIAPLEAICYLHPFSKSLLMVAINGSVWLQAA